MKNTIFGLERSSISIPKCICAVYSLAITSPKKKKKNQSTRVEFLKGQIKKKTVPD